MRRPQPRATGRVVDLTRDPMAPPELVTKAILDGLDETARQMERKWGVGRLRLLVDDALRAKFDAQKAKLDAAIATDQEIYVRAQAAGRSSTLRTGKCRPPVSSVSSRNSSGPFCSSGVRLGEPSGSKIPIP